MTTRPSFIAITSPLVLAAMLLLPSSMASAALTGACLKDAKALCAGVQPGGGKIRACLKTHLKDLSDDCQAVVLKAVNAKACAADVKQFCADAKAGEGRIEACIFGINGHYQAVSLQTFAMTGPRELKLGSRDAFSRGVSQAATSRFGSFRYRQ